MRRSAVSGKRRRSQRQRTETEAKAKAMRLSQQIKDKNNFFDWQVGAPGEGVRGGVRSKAAVGVEACVKL